MVSRFPSWLTSRLHLRRRGSHGYMCSRQSRGWVGRWGERCGSQTRFKEAPRPWGRVRTHQGPQRPGGGRGQSPGGTEKAGDVTLPSGHTSREGGRAPGPRHGAARLTLIEADLVPQDHHAFRQQLVLKATHRCRHCFGGGGEQGPAGKAPGSPPATAEAQG